MERCSSQQTMSRIQARLASPPLEIFLFPSVLLIKKIKYMVNSIKEYKYG
jgi:hypothetical protein